MEDAEAVQLIENTMRVLADSGYIVTGELIWLKPKKPGMVTVDMTISRSSPMMMLAKICRAAYVAPTAPTGDICTRCGGSRFQQTGTCKTCLDCGEPGGCS